MLPARRSATASEDRDALRRRVIELADEGMSKRAIAREVGTSEATVRRMLAQAVAL
ncbi:helix-turn-helix domain-containing protein [Rhodococcus sp. NPDC049939]|uniref:helix-turn-helix domain-containing protein n=1 Tax=Rhodococcus sp. NPDC049939 TaxID=3155511 RepID=UPI0033E7F878